MPYWQRVPTELQQQFLDEIVEDYLKSHPMNAEGLIHLPMVRLEIEDDSGTDVRSTMKDAEKTIGNLIDHASVSIIGSVDEAGFPNTKAMLPPRKENGRQAHLLHHQHLVDVRHHPRLAADHRLRCRLFGAGPADRPTAAESRRRTERSGDRPGDRAV